jgi:hypothetical protein
LLAGECYRESDAKREHGPVCRGVEARPPHRAAVNLSAIEVCKRANRGRVERVWTRGWLDCFHHCITRNDFKEQYSALFGSGPSGTAHRRLG